MPRGAAAYDADDLYDPYDDLDNDDDDWEARALARVCVCVRGVVQSPGGPHARNAACTPPCPRAASP